MNLLDEIDRLRRELEYRSNQHRLDESDMLRTFYEGVAEGERRATAAVVAWLRAKRNLMGDMPNKACRWAEAIERGEHRREEKTP